MRDSCKKCGAPFDEKNTRVKLVKGSDGKVRRSRECKKCNLVREAARRSRIRAGLFLTLKGMPRLAGEPRKRVKEVKHSWSCRRTADFCQSCAAGECRHRGSACLEVVARPPADHVCFCGDAWRVTTPPKFNSTLRRG